MHKQSKANRIKVHIKMFLAIVILVGLTLLVLEVPKIIYQREDVQLVNNVSFDEYDIASATVDMYEKTIAEALFKEDTLFIETSKTYEQSEIQTYRKQLFSLITKSTTGRLQSYFKNVLLGNTSIAKLKNVRIVRIIDDVAYAGEIGVLSFYDYGNDEFDASMGSFVFDMNGGKLIQIACYACNDSLGLIESSEYEYTMPEYYQPYYSSDAVYLYEYVFDYDLEKSFILPKDASDYMGDIPSIDDYYVYISPFDRRNVRWIDNEYGGYWDYDYNQVMDHISHIVSEMLQNYSD